MRRLLCPCQLGRASLVGNSPALGPPWSWWLLPCDTCTGQERSIRGRGTKAPGADVKLAQSQESLAPAHLGCPEPKGRSLLSAPPWQTDSWFPTCPGAVAGTG